MRGLSITCQNLYSFDICRYVPLFPTFHQQKGLSNSFQIRRPGGDSAPLDIPPCAGPEAGRALGLLSDEKRPPCSPLQRPTGTFVTNPHPQGRLGSWSPRLGAAGDPARLDARRQARCMEKKAARPHAQAGPARRGPEGRGRPSARPGPAAPGGRFPAPALRSSLHGLRVPAQLWTPAPPLAFPPLGLPVS